MKKLELKKHAKGLAYVRYNGKCVYFGKFGSEDAERRFKDWNRRRELEEKDPQQITLLMLAAQFMVHAEQHYQKNGELTGEVENFRQALRTASKLFGNLRVLDFGPKKLKEIREQMIADGLARSTVNSRIRRIRHVFKWGVSEQLVPAEILVGLQAVAGLQAGRTAAREPEPVGPVPEDRIESLRPFLSRQVWGLIQFMKRTGARPGEAIRIRWCDIDADQAVWIYRPGRHKNQHRGKKRLIAIGPEAQKILNEFPGADSDYIFRPQQALNEFVGKAYGRRTTKRVVGDHYSIHSVQSAIKIACEKAFECPADLTTRALCRKLKGESDRGLENRKLAAAEWRSKNCWHANQLRHNAATMMRSKGGVDVAQVALGHSSVRTTEIYAEMNIDAAVRYAAEHG